MLLEEESRTSGDGSPLTSSLGSPVIIVQVRSHSPDSGSFQFSQSPNTLPPWAYQSLWSVFARLDPTLRSSKRRDGSPDQPQEDGPKTRPVVAARLCLFEEGISTHPDATRRKADQGEKNGSSSFLPIRS